VIVRPAAVLLAVVALAACGGSDRASTAGAGAEAAPASSSPPRTLLGLVFEKEQAQLQHLDPLTLRPAGKANGPWLSAGMHAFSPDRRTLVPARGDEQARLRFVDLPTLRLRGTLALPVSGWASEFLWESADRLTVLLQADDPAIVAIDPRARRVLGSSRLDGVPVASQTRAGRMVVLLAPRDAIGPSRLAVVDAARGLLGTVALEIEAGSEPIEDPDDQHAIRARTPGVAVSPDGTRAVLVSAGARVAEVDLDELRVEYHELSEPGSLLGRLRSWLEPEARAKVMEGPHRFARFAGERHVAVTGIDYHGVEDGEWRADPVGLEMVDTRDWSVRTVADHVTGLAGAGVLVLAFGGGWPEGAAGAGLLAYGPDSRERFHALGSDPVAWVETASPYAYVADPASQGQRFRVIDLVSGEVVATARTNRPVAILATAR
jgi:hypothetical protein